MAGTLPSTLLFKQGYYSRLNLAIIALAKRKIEVIVLQLGKLDLASLAGKLMLDMLAAVAEMERDMLVVKAVE